MFFTGVGLADGEEVEVTDFEEVVDVVGFDEIEEVLADEVEVVFWVEDVDVTSTFTVLPVALQVGLMALALQAAELESVTVEV